MRLGQWRNGRSLGTNHRKESAVGLEDHTCLSCRFRFAFPPKVVERWIFSPPKQKITRNETARQVIERGLKEVAAHERN